MRKFLCVVLTVVMLLATACVTVVSADEIVETEATGIILKEFKGTDGKTNQPEETYEKNEETGVWTLNEEYSDHAWGFDVKELEPYRGQIIKTAFYITVNSISDTSQKVRINPFIKGEDPWVERWVDVDYGTFADYEGEKIIIVGAFTIPEDKNEMEARIYVNKGANFSIDKVIVATNEYNFANDLEYELVYEWVDENNDPEAAEEIIESERTIDDQPDETEQPDATDEVPATDAPVTEAPATEAPATDAPATDAPATEAPAATDADDVQPKEGGDMTIIIIIIAVAVIAVVAVVVVVVTKKKK